MKKFFRVFYSQVFNAFFPILIVLVLIRFTDKNNIAQIFLITNFANIYLLFSDYSANTRFLKNTLASGGITLNTKIEIVEDIASYIGIKIIILSLGFLGWGVLCWSVPLLNHNFWGSLLSYTFIVAYNINYYWVYMSSNKEHFYIVSTFVSRIFFLMVIGFFIYYHFNLYYALPIIGLLTFIANYLFFVGFCRLHSITVQVNLKKISKSKAIIKSDLPTVINSFLLMTPTNCITIFIGYVKNTEQLVAYALAEKIFFGVRTLLAVFVNSIYPLFCSKDISRKRKTLIFVLFYIALLIFCICAYLLAPFTVGYFRFTGNTSIIFIHCLFYFFLTIIVISLNIPFLLWLLLNNHINAKKTTWYLVIAALSIISCFLLYTGFAVDVLTIVKSLFIAESTILITFALLYWSKKINVASLDIVQ